jgi:hypothetical protein
MLLARSGIAVDPRRFGRGRSWILGAAAARAPVSADLKLFATTFAAGFLFVSVLLA